MSTARLPLPVSQDRCPFDLCDGSGFVIDERANDASDCRCRAQRVSRMRARKLGGVIPRKYRGVSFDRPPVTEISAPVVLTVRRFVNHIDKNLAAGRGLWFFGSVGTGKTTLAMLISRYAADAGHSVAIYSLPRLLATIRATYDDEGDSYIDLIDRLTSVDLLHIDDLGMEPTKDEADATPEKPGRKRDEERPPQPTYSPWVLEQLYAIVNARYEAERSIVITTNLDREELAKQINERTVSRLKEMCEPVPLFGQDARGGYRSDGPTA